MEDIGIGRPRPWPGLVARIEDFLAGEGISAAELRVVLPYPALLPTARGAWAAARPSGFAPRMDTLQGWARTLASDPVQPPQVTCDTARDLITAQGLLQQAGLRNLQRALAPRLAEAAQQLVRARSAVSPAERGAWAERAREAVGAVGDNPLLAYEAAVARIALEWVLASACAGDVLFAPAAMAGSRALVFIDSVQPEPQAEALAAWWLAQGLPVLRLSLASADRGAPALPVRVRLHAAGDAEDEAERAAASVLWHVEAGRLPVALVAQDRALTRRISAMLRARGVALTEESGWRLSTTRAAAHVLSALRACARQASGDAVLGWIKQAPLAAQAATRQLEAALRRNGARLWQHWRAPADAHFAGAAALTAQFNALREEMQAPRPFTSWLGGLRTLLEASGQWSVLQSDAAGRQVIAVLRLDAAAQQAFGRELEPVHGSGRKLAAADFIAWAEQALEAQTFIPAHPQPTQVAVLPLPQLAGRGFAAVVAPGCDERNLPASPDPMGAWTPAQREALGLPGRAQLQQAQLAAWHELLASGEVDILWRTADRGEAQLPSPLVLVLQADPSAWTGGDDKRLPRDVAVSATPVPMPSGAALAVSQLSASAYEDLRRCPYRFFALRQLRLQDSDELETELDKRDFGLWLHAVLRHFHELLVEEGASDEAARHVLLERAADAVRAEQGLAPEEFLPFSAAWPQLRQGYLSWLATHESEGLGFQGAESWHEQSLGSLRLIGQIDRIDRAAALPQDEGSFVIDYKTEGLQVTRERIKRWGEDTQLAFYAALLPHGTLRAAYVNVGEGGVTTTVEMEDVLQARDALVEGILSDVERIADGHPMPALGEGQVCDFCSARGLCRKDFWNV